MSPEPAGRHGHTGVPLRMDFTPKRGARLALAVVALLCAGSAVWTGVVAWQDPTQPMDARIGIPATLGALALIIWAALAVSSVTHVSIERGILEVTTSGTTQRLDLASPHQSVEVVGDPRRRGWQVRLHRHHGDPLVIDRSMVDPVAFTQALGYYRPAADPGPDSDRRRR